MRNFTFFILALLLEVAVLSAQTPQSFRYQAVARNNSGNIIANQAVSFRISILSGGVAGTEAYCETHTGLSTNAFGLVELEIGKGTPINGIFSSIDWGSNSYFVKIEMDQAGGSNYQVLSTSQLLSVPYALYAKNVENNNDADANPANEIQTLTLSGNTLGITNGNSIDLPEETGDNWGNQVVVTDLSLAGNGLTANPLKIPDNSVTSAKIQDGAVSSTDLADNAVISIKVKDGTIETADLSDLAVNKEKLAAASVTTDKINISAVTSDKLAANAVISAKIATGAVTGDKIAQAGAISGQALKWNGSSWAPATDATVSGGWVDDGTTIRLNTSDDTIVIGSVNKIGKLNVEGDIGMMHSSSIFFGNNDTRITGMIGGDLRFVAEDLSMLTTEDITFGHFGDETWIKFDNTNKRVGIGILAPSDRLHVVLDDAAAGLSAIKGVANQKDVSSYGIYGESKSATGYGMFGKSPKYGVYGTATGFQGRGIVGEATNTSSIGVQGIATNTSSTGVWGEGSNQGIYGFSSSATGKGVYGKVSSDDGYSGYFEGGKLYVKGKAEVKDTLFANVLKATKITNMPGLANSIAGAWNTYHSLATSWAELNSVTVNVPAPGYVLLFVSCEFLSDHNYNDATAVFLGISNTSDGEGIKQIAHWKVNILAGTEFISEDISAQGVLQVTSAGSQTFYLMGYRKGGDNTDVVYRHQCNLTALYIPVAYGTVE